MNTAHFYFKGIAFATFALVTPQASAVADTEADRTISEVRYATGDSMTISCLRSAGCEVTLVVRGKKIFPKAPINPENTPWYAGDFLLIRSTIDKNGYLIRYPVACGNDQFDEIHAKCYFERRFSGSKLEDESRITKFVYDSPQ